MQSEFGPNSNRCLALVGWAAFFLASGTLIAGEPIRVVPHRDAGKRLRDLDADRPKIALYGGIGLQFQGEKNWTDYGELTREEIDYLLDRCDDNGVYRVHANLLETLTPASPELSEAERKTLVAYFFQAANARGIEVFADMPVFGYFVEADREFVKDHPGAFTHSASGESDTHMLSAANEDVRRYKRSQLMSFVKDYPVSGLQLDFIRYPYYTLDLRLGFGKHGYDSAALASFEGSNSDHASCPAPEELAWVRHKADFVSQFIRELREDLAASQIDLPIGVYNSATYGRDDSLRTVHQNWKQWEKEGLVDEHHPMILMSDGLPLLTRATQSLIEVRRNGNVFGPIFLAEGFRTSEGDVPTPDLVRRAARSLIKLGCDGLWVCRSSEVEEFNLWPVLNEISQWSISDIRAEDFDPFAENLLTPAAEWGIEPSQTSIEDSQIDATDSRVRVHLSPESPTRLSRSVEFRGNRHLSAQSLVFACRIAPSDKVEKLPILEVTLHYLDGSREDFQFRCPPVNEPMSTTTIAIPVKCDFADIVLKRVDLTLVFPPGSGAVEIIGAALQRDPVNWNAE